VTPHIHPLEIGFGFEKLAKEGIYLNLIRDNRVFLKVTLVFALSLDLLSPPVPSLNEVPKVRKFD
jgi:hypothetical protein